MRKTFVLTLCVLFALSLLAVGAYAKNTQSKFSQYKFVEEPQQPTNAPEIGGSMFQAAAATTVVLGWWQFDTPGGAPDEAGVDGIRHHGPGQEVLARRRNAGGAVPRHHADQRVRSRCGAASGRRQPLPGADGPRSPATVTTGTRASEPTAANVTTLAYTIMWDSEPGYDFTYVEWWDAVNSAWVADPAANAAAGCYDDAGGPLADRDLRDFRAYGPTKVRFHFASDGAWSDEDGLWDTDPGRRYRRRHLDQRRRCRELGRRGLRRARSRRTASGSRTIPPGFGALLGSSCPRTAIVQEDPCAKPLSNLWAFFDNPATTNYACGGWPLQGAMPYGPDANGLYMINEIWSPFVPITGLGSEFILAVPDLP